MKNYYRNILNTVLMTTLEFQKIGCGASVVN